MQALVARLTAERAITLASERRVADAAQEALHGQLTAKDRQLRAAQARGQARRGDS